MFITLHFLHKQPIYVNVFDISVFYYEQKDGFEYSRVFMTGDNEGVKVDETPEEILALIAGVGK